MKKKPLLLLLLFALVVNLCGCGDAGSGNAGTATGEVAAGNGEIDLLFWCDGDELELFQEMIDQFREIHKDEVTINMSYDTIGASACKDTIVADIENCADLFSMPDDQLLTLVAAGVLEPVENEDEIASRNLPGSVEAASFNGHVYAYPTSADNGYFLFYDKKYFKESDVETLDRILEICEQNDKKFVMDWSSGWYLYAFFGNTGMTLSLNEDGLTNFCDWNSTENSIKGVDVAKSLLAISRSKGFLSDGGWGELAKQGEAIAVVSGVWDINAMKEAYGDYGACKLPTYTCKGQQIQMSSFTGYRLLGVNSYSPNKEWAAKLADYLTNEESQALRFERSERGPSNINASASDAVNQVPAIKAVQEQAQYGVLQKVGQRFWTPSSNFGVAMAEGNPGNKPLQDLLDAMVEGITQ